MSVRNRFKNLITWFSLLPGNVTEKLHQFESKLPAPMLAVVAVCKNTIRLFISHSTGTLGASLSYYMIFSIAPIMIIIVSVGGLVLGPQAVSGSLKHQVESVLGANAANGFQDIVKGAYHPRKNWIATTLSIILLLFGSIGVFDELRHSLNIIWDIPLAKKKRFITYLVNRSFSFGMLACMAFLLLVSLVIQTGLAIFSDYLSNVLSAVSKILLPPLAFILSLGLSTLLFAFIYKYMSDAKMKFSVVWPGALFTAILFDVGKFLIGLYISKSNIANAYGAASSLVVLLLWIFYSSQIVFFGAEFTRSLALQRGIKLSPASTDDALKKPEERSL